MTLSDPEDAEPEDGADAFFPEPEQERLIEALLFAADAPLSDAALALHLPDDADLPARIDALEARYADRGVRLVRAAGGWAFRTAPDLAGRLSVVDVAARRLSRAGVETLAIIAYHQPVTRAEIENIRGVALSKGTLDALLEVGWVKPIGRRRSPGRPVTWGVTPGFLDHFGLDTVEDLPGIEELKRSGLLEDLPAYGADLSEDEDEDPRQIRMFEDAAAGEPLDEADAAADAVDPAATEPPAA
ncbi:MAG: SMC-Scp complex subunit ScpB [Pseudomonadota bacterium]